MKIFKTMLLSGLLIFLSGIHIQAQETEKNTHCILTLGGDIRCETTGALPSDEGVEHILIMQGGDLYLNGNIVQSDGSQESCLDENGEISSIGDGPPKGCKPTNEGELCYCEIRTTGIVETGEWVEKVHGWVPVKGESCEKTSQLVRHPGGVYKITQVPFYREK